MLIDFCHSALGSLIKSDKVSSDGYEAANLVSNDPQLRQKGFLSEYFIKPPVGVTVQFPCNIEIYRIVLDPVIGRQKSCNIEVYTASEKLQKSYLFDANISSKSTDFDCSSLLFVCVGKSVSVDPKVTCFQNVMFQSRSQWSTDNIPSVDYYPIRRELRHGKRQSLAYVSHVTIRVTRVGSGSAVAIRHLEIWGKPSTSLPKELQDKLYNIFQQAIKPPPQNKVVPSKESSNETFLANEIRADACAVIEKGVEIPEDFIDAITCDVMTVPMLLPCGKNVDQKTLETYIDTEASWGRAPSDPFTGVPFQIGKGAIPNSSLKTRIDQFLLTNSERLKHLPRILGTKDPSSVYQPSSSRLVSSLKVSTSGQHGNEDSELLSSNKNVSSWSSTQSFPNSITEHNIRIGKRRGSDLVFRADSNKLITEPPTKLRKLEPNQVRNCTASVGLHVSLHTSTVKQTSAPVKHSDKLNSSLDQALNSALGSLPSFTAFSKPAESSEKILGSSCCDCSRDLTVSSVVKYKLPCSHFICRNCSIKITGIFVCDSCGARIKSEELLRVF